MTDATRQNPFFEPWDGPFGLPPFADIRTEDFLPAFERAMAEHRAEIAAIAADPAAPTFDNTFVALERAGAAMNRVGGVFWNLTGVESTRQLQDIERELAPRLADHYAAISLNAPLFQRVAAVWERRDTLSLNREQKRLVELGYDGFVRSGALLDPAQKKRFAEIAGRLATLGAQFAQNILKDEADWAMLLDESDLDGLPQSLRAGAARAAADRGSPHKFAITLARSSVEPFLTYSSRRDLREKAFAAWIRRGENEGATDNRAIAVETLRLRKESAALLGFPTYAHFKLADQMAKTPDNARALIDKVWEPAKAAVARDRVELQKLVAADGGNFEIAAHDWRFYAEKLRKALHDIDENEIRPYLELDAVIGAAFDVAHRLFGLDFAERKDLTLYNCEARAFDVTDENGKHVALFIGDYFARPTKRGGAWMSDFRAQSGLDGKDVRPIVINVLNCAKGAESGKSAKGADCAEGQPTLISLTDAKTLFHEFGHALHGMLAQSTYPSISGTNVTRDFVEFPSQLYEHWLLRPETLARFARHAETGAPIPADLVARIGASEKFNVGWEKVEFCSSAILDLDMHLMALPEDFDIIAYERAQLDRIGMPKEIVMRHRTPHFGHVFSGSGYASGYYSYLWSAVLDADGFAAFEEAGDVFDPALARRLKTHVYAAGASAPPEEAFRAFRGRDPDTRALLKAQGFA
ncbi:MAG: M3 family metallopeptidase [Rhodoblastus sp.]